MKRKKAIQILENQKQKVLDKNIKNDKQLVIQTCSFIIDFFSTDSPEFHYINKFDFNIDFHPNVPKENKPRVLKNRENEFIIFLDNCKHTLKEKGIYKPKDRNWFSHKTNDFILKSIIGIFIAGIPIGYWIREVELFSLIFKKEKTESTFTSQTESLPLLTSDIPKTPTETMNKNDSTNNKKLTIKERIK